MAIKGTKPIETITGKTENEKKFLEKMKSDKKKELSEIDKFIRAEYRKKFA